MPLGEARKLAETCPCELRTNDTFSLIQKLEVAVLTRYPTVVFKKSLSRPNGVQPTSNESNYP